MSFTNALATHNLEISYILYQLLLSLLSSSYGLSMSPLTWSLWAANLPF